MTWDELRAAYPPHTWLVLEVIDEESYGDWHYFEPVRVLEVVPADADPISRERAYEHVIGKQRVLAFSTSEAPLRIQNVFMGFRIPDVEDESDVGRAAVRVVDLRPPGSRRHARPRGR